MAIFNSKLLNYQRVYIIHIRISLLRIGDHPLLWESNPCFDRGTKKGARKIDSILLQIGKFDGTFTSKFTIFSNKTIFIDFHRD